MTIRDKATKRKDMASLRKRMDGDDRFMEGHQIRKLRARHRAVPDWAVNDELFRKILLRSFPGCDNSHRAARRAGRWARIVYLFYRMNFSYTYIAKELGCTENRVKMTLRTIRWAAEGRNTATGKRSKGRESYTIQEPYGEVRGDRDERTVS